MLSPHNIRASKLMLLFFIVAALVLGLAGPAGAEEVTKAVPSTVTLEPWVVAIIGGTLIPLLVGVATKLGASPGLKAVIGLVLVAVVTALNVIVTNNGTFVIRDVVVLFATTFVVHVASYYGLWKPIGGGAAPGAEATKNFGVG